MTCGTPDQIAASVLSLPLWNAGPGCATSLRSYWENLSVWPFSFFTYFPYFLVTLTLEGLALAVLLRIQKIKITRRWLITCLMVNLASHPLAFYLTPLFSNAFRIRWDYCLVGVEFLVLILEALIYSNRMRLSVKRAFVYSWLINLVSWWVGSFILT